MRHLTCWLALLAGLGLVSSVPTWAADKDDEAVAKLIKKLGSSRFSERQKAQKELDKIGMPAFAALRKAAESKDPETARRAGELLAKLEKQALTAQVLTATTVHLKFKDTPLPEAVKEFAKQTGYNISLHDPQGMLKTRKITLDTGKTTFWKAFDQFCAKAGLVEATQQDLNQPVPFPGGGGVLPPGKPVPPVQIQPAPPIQKLPLKKGAAKPQAQLQVAFAVQAVQAAPAQKAVPAVQPAPAIQIQPLPAIRRGPFRPFNPMQPGQILLKDGKAKEMATAYTGAVRIRVMENPQQQLGQAGKDEIMVGLDVSPEPKIRWQSLVGLRIDKAVDDQGQSLAPMMGGAPGGPGNFGFNGGFGGPAFPGGGGFGGFQPFNPGNGLHQYLPVRLKKGEKATKSLKELSGAITASVLAEPKALITVDNILKASSKTVKGKDGGWIKVNAVETTENVLKLRLEMQQPANVMPAGQGGFGGFGFQGGMPGGIGGGPVQIQILPVAPPPPPPAPAPAPKLKLKGAFQVQAQQAQAAPAKVQVIQAQAQPVQVIQLKGGRVIQIGGGGGGIGWAGGGSNGLGLELLDDKGNVIPSGGFGVSGVGGPGGFKTEYQLTYQLKKGQKPAKLVFKGSKLVSVEIPFKLEKVTLP